MRRWFVIGASILAVLAIAIVVSRSGGGSSDAAASQRQPAHDGSVSSAAAAPDAEPVTDLDGATQAALTAVAATGDVATAGYISRRELIVSFATPEFGSKLADTTSDQLRGLAVEMGARDAAVESMTVVEQPISVTAMSTPDGASVDVYSVLVVAIPGAGPARQVWRTVSLDMVLVGDRWLVDGWESAAGPTPALPAEVAIASADDVAARLAWGIAGRWG